MGNAYRTLAEVEEKAENCRRAIAAYEAALTVYTPDRFPMDYAMTQNNLGNAYRTLAEVEEKAENCEKAKQAYLAAITIFGRAQMQVPIQVVLGNLHGLRNLCGDAIDWGELEELFGGPDSGQ